MKKIIAIILTCFLVGCTTNDNVSEATAKRYNEMITLLNEQVEYTEEESYFSIYAEISKVSDGYRYYIFIENPKVAMYNVEAIAITNGVDYTTNMASNVGIFDETKYNLVPNQVKIEDGYAKGIMLSGISSYADNDLYVLVQWRDVSLTNVSREFIHLIANYSGD